MEVYCASNRRPLHRNKVQRAFAPNTVWRNELAALAKIVHNALSPMVKMNPLVNAILALCLTSGALSAETTLAPAVTKLNKELRTRPNRTQLAERAQLLRDLIVRRPAEARKLLFTGAELEQMRPFADADLLESFHSEATTTVLIADSEDRTYSTHIYFVDTPGGRVTAYQDSTEAPQTSCGDQIQLDGYRLGNVMAVANATVIRAADPQPNCNPTGEHRVAVLMLKIPGLPDLVPTPDQVQQQFFDTVGQSTATFYQENSLGAASITGDVFGPFTMDRLYSCSETSALLTQAVNLADKTVDFSKYTHVHMLFSSLPGGCGWAGVGSVGCSSILSPSKGRLPMAYVWQAVSRAYLLRETTHEIGHNFGLGHSRSVEFPGETLAPDRTHAIYTEYGDQFSTMGSTDAYHFSAAHKEMLKWYKDGVDFQTVNANAEFDLPPVETQATGVKALRVRRNLGRATEWVWVEYRQPLGLFDTRMSATAWEGALLHYQTIETGLYAEAIDTTPRRPGSPSASFGDITLLPGRVWQDPYSDLTIEVVSATPEALKVRVRYDTPCADVVWPKTLTLTNDAGQIVPSISPKPGCSFTSAGNNYWLTTAQDGSGKFSLSENTLPVARAGSLTVARQTLLVSQPGKRVAPTVYYVSPFSGAVAAASGVTFSVAINAPGGASSLGLVDLQIGDPSAGPVCHVRWDYAGRKFYLFPDTGSTLLTGTTVSSSACTVTSPGFSTLAQPATLAVTASISLSALAVGNRDILASVGYVGDLQPPALQKIGTVRVAQDCQPGLSARRISASGAGTSLVVTFNATSTCSWKAGAMDPWVTVSPASGTGSGSLAVTIAANSGTEFRSSSITLQDEIVQVVQSGSGMPFYPNVQFNSSEILLSRTSGKDRVYFISNLPAPAMTGVSNSDWLRVATIDIDPVLGAYLSYTYDANFGTQRRVGSITIGGAPLYFSQQGTVALPVADYTISNLVGTSDVGDGGPASQAFLSGANQMAYDAAGNLYIAESDYYRIRKVGTDGTIQTIAGTGYFGTASDGDAAARSPLAGARGVAIDSKGAVYVSEGPRVRVIRDDGSLLTIASGLSGSAGLAFDGKDNLYIAEQNAHRIRMYSADGKLSTVAGTGTQGNTGDGGAAISARLNFPGAVAVDPQGNLMICDTSNFTIRQVTGGVIRAIAGTGRAAYTADGAQAAQASLILPQSVAVDAQGVVYIAESNRVRFIDSKGALATIAGGGSGRPQDGADAKTVGLTTLGGSVISPAGQLSFADVTNQVVRSIRDDQTLSTLAGREAWMPVGDGGPAAQARLFWPQGAALGNDGSIYIADTRNNRIRRVAADGTIDTIAGTGQWGFAGDRGPAKSAMLRNPTSVALDAAGNVFFADSVNSRVRKVDTNGIITTVAGGGPGFSGGDGGPATSAAFNNPQGVALDPAGNLYITDTFNSRIRMVSPDGKIATIGGTGTYGFSGDGGAASKAAMRYPFSIVLDAMGNIYFSDVNNGRVRRIASDGTITTVAGSGTSTSGDSAYALNSSLSVVYGLSVAPTGELWIADGSNHRILEVLPDGSVFTIAGTTSPGGDGDGGPAWNATLNVPSQCLPDGAGRVYVLDMRNNRIRLLQ